MKKQAPSKGQPKRRHDGNGGDFEKTLAQLVGLSEKAFASGKFARLQGAVVEAIDAADDASQLWSLLSIEGVSEATFGEDAHPPQVAKALLARADKWGDTPDAASAIALVVRASAIDPAPTLLPTLDETAKPKFLSSFGHASLRRSHRTPARQEHWPDPRRGPRLAPRSRVLGGSPSSHGGKARLERDRRPRRHRFHPGRDPGRVGVEPTGTTGVVDHHRGATLPLGDDGGARGRRRCSRDSTPQSGRDSADVTRKHAPPRDLGALVVEPRTQLVEHGAAVLLRGAPRAGRPHTRSFPPSFRAVDAKMRQ